jgi:predicted metal-dependent enzyme (double-stranded beta helix superfamily)
MTSVQPRTRTISIWNGIRTPLLVPFRRWTGVAWGIDIPMAFATSEDGLMNRDDLILEFHTKALALLEDDSEENRHRIAILLRELALQPGILPDVALDRLHDTGSTATILHQGEDGRGALMLLRLPDDAPTPIHNHNTWGVAVVVQGTNHYWRWVRTDDLSDPNHADLELAGDFEHGPGEYVVWGDPPDDLHAQQGVNGAAYEFVFFGRNPNMQPRAYFDAGTGAITYASAVDAAAMR